MDIFCNCPETIPAYRDSYWDRNVGGAAGVPRHDFEKEMVWHIYKKVTAQGALQRHNDPRRYSSSADNRYGEPPLRHRRPRDQFRDSHCQEHQHYWPIEPRSRMEPHQA
jgi:hypothetical protein